MRTTKFNPEVFFAADHVVTVKRDDLAFLQEAADRSHRRRSRVCAHKDAEETLHEMIVVLKRDAYMIPDKHLVKVESYHIIEGLADVVVYDEAGEITEVIRLGDYASGRAFYFRERSPNFYHSLIVRSDILIYHETATGPFRKSDTLAAPWAPPESDAAGMKAFTQDLERRVDEFLARREKLSAAN
jgi:cupin fold WbuC family metalloprotein